MKAKILNLCLILFSLLGYLEWGDDKHQFLFQVEFEVLGKLFTDFTSIIHPFILLPLLGQVILIYTLFQKSPGKILTYIAIGGLGMLFLLMLFIGIISANFKIILSTLPFLITAVFTIFNFHNKLLSN